jgi:hypothetical protein
METETQVRLEPGIWVDYPMAAIGGAIVSGLVAFIGPETVLFVTGDWCYLSECENARWTK